MANNSRVSAEAIHEMVAATQRPVDPTENVKELVRQGLKSERDLRLQANHYQELMDHLRMEHIKELRLAESQRIDAIRTVDVGNVTRAGEVAAAAAAALATQLEQSAVALRNQVEQTRITTADALLSALQPIQTDVAELRKVQFQQQGEKTQNVENTTSKRDLSENVRGHLTVCILVAGAIAGYLIHR